MKQREGRRTAIIGLLRPTPAPRPCSSVVEQRFCKALVASSTLVGGFDIVKVRSPWRQGA